MGTRGPVPKRKDDASADVDIADGAERVSIPHADPTWHPIARRLWDSMKTSGQASFYEPSDWAFAYSIMDDLSYYKNANKRSGQMMASLYSAMTALLLTEGDRRRVAIELVRKQVDLGDSPGVVEMNKWRDRLSS